LIRVTKLFGPSSAQDITWAAVDSHTWSMIEVNSGIIAGCVPTLKPLFRSCFTFLRDTSNNSRPTYENDIKERSNFSGSSGKRNWRQNSQHIALSSVATKSTAKSANQQSPRVLGKMYQSQISKSDEELIMNDQGPTEREIWRTTEFKIDVESASTNAKSSV
jgi:hypothetical protein